MADRAGAVRVLVRVLRRVLVFAGLTIAALLGCALLSTAGHAAGPVPPVVAIPVPARVAAVTGTVTAAVVRTGTATVRQAVVTVRVPVPVPVPAESAVAPREVPVRAVEPAPTAPAVAGHRTGARTRSATGSSAAGGRRPVAPVPARPNPAAADSGASAGTRGSRAPDRSPATAGVLTTPDPLQLLGVVAGVP